MRTIYNQFPDYGDFPIDIDDMPGGEWFDSSWHNDTAPCMANDTLFRSHLVRLFCDYEKPEQRESEDYERYILLLTPIDDDEIIREFYSDDLAETIEKIKQWHREYIAGGEKIPF